MVNRVHVIDPDIRRRARVSRELHALGHHVEIYEDIDEFLGQRPAEGLVLSADDPPPGQQTCEIIQTTNIGLPIIAYAGSPAPERIVEAMLAGACGYLAWPFDGRQLVIALGRLAEEGSRRLLRERVLEEARTRVERLSPRERQVLIGLIAGLSNKQIGQSLGISPRTVEIHRSNMMARLGAKTIAEAVRIGLHAGLDEYCDALHLQEVA